MLAYHYAVIQGLFDNSVTLLACELREAQDCVHAVPSVWRVSAALVTE